MRKRSNLRNIALGIAAGVSLLAPNIAYADSTATQGVNVSFNIPPLTALYVNEQDQLTDLMNIGRPSGTPEIIEVYKDRTKISITPEIQEQFEALLPSLDLTKSWLYKVEPQLLQKSLAGLETALTSLSPLERAVTRTITDKNAGLSYDKVIEKIKKLNLNSATGNTTILSTIYENPEGKRDITTEIVEN